MAEVGHNRLALAGSTDTLSSRQAIGRGCDSAKSSRRHPHLQQHGVSNTEAAAAVAALPVLDLVSCDPQIRFPMATALLYNAPICKI